MTISRIRACQIYKVLLPTFQLDLSAKILKFRSRTSVLSWLLKIWSYASALPLSINCQRSEVTLPHCPGYQWCEVPLPHLRSALNTHDLTWVFKALNGQAPEYLSDLLITCEQIKNLRSNDKEILKVPFSKTAYYDRSFSVSCATLWNSLPLYLRQSTNINTFKKSLIRYICKTVKHKSTFSAGFWHEKKHTLKTLFIYSKRETGGDR